MRQRAFLMLGLAVVLGIVAVFLIRGVISRHAPEVAASGNVVVAKVPLNFGDPLSPQNLVAVPWPAESVPVGAFGSVEQILPPGIKRVALQTMVKGEPVLINKVSGPGGRATLSAVIDKSKRAMTIGINDVLGVAGFVLPGDHVDIMLTRRDQNNPTTEVLLQNIRVLGIDQDANQQKDKPAIARAATLEVTTDQAQKLTLAATVGTLSLALRNSANTEQLPTSPVGLADLRPTVDQPVKTETSAKPAIDPLAPVLILRGTTPTQYEVGIAGAGSRS
ncbi:MAG TPA: Flp pilus assembly protein CpaB [Stellaceae bacterium]|nr:Flp pilus assembly protein CpaB [Stellaceae bacterium]